MKLKPGKTVVVFLKDFPDYDIYISDIGVYKLRKSKICFPEVIDVESTHWFFSADEFEPIGEL